MKSVFMVYISTWVIIGISLVIGKYIYAQTHTHIYNIIQVFSQLFL